MVQASLQDIIKQLFKRNELWHMKYMLQDLKGFNCVRLLICVWYFKSGNLAYIVFYLWIFCLLWDIAELEFPVPERYKIVGNWEYENSSRSYCARRFSIHHTWPGATKLLYVYYVDQHAYALLDLRFVVGWMVSFKHKQNETQDRHSFLMTPLFFKKFVGKGTESIS